mgnify:CR=1 FL=1
MPPLARFSWNKGQLEKARNDAGTQARRARDRMRAEGGAGVELALGNHQGICAACAPQHAARCPAYLHPTLPASPSVCLQTNPLATVARGVLSGVPTALLIVASITRLQDTRYNK